MISPPLEIDALKNALEEANRQLYFRAEENRLLRHEIFKKEEMIFDLGASVATIEVEKKIDIEKGLQKFRSELGFKAQEIAALKRENDALLKRQKLLPSTVNHEQHSSNSDIGSSVAYNDVSCQTSVETDIYSGTLPSNGTSLLPRDKGSSLCDQKPLGESRVLPSDTEINTAGIATPANFSQQFSTLKSLVRDNRPRITSVIGRSLQPKISRLTSQLASHIEKLRDVQLPSSPRNSCVAPPIVPPITSPAFVLNDTERTSSQPRYLQSKIPSLHSLLTTSTTQLGPSNAAKQQDERSLTSIEGASNGSGESPTFGHLKSQRFRAALGSVEQSDDEHGAALSNYLNLLSSCLLHVEFDIARLLPGIIIDNGPLQDHFVFSILLSLSVLSCALLSWKDCRHTTLDESHRSISAISDLLPISLICLNMATQLLSPQEYGSFHSVRLSLMQVVQSRKEILSATIVGNKKWDHLSRLNHEKITIGNSVTRKLRRLSNSNDNHGKRLVDAFDCVAQGDSTLLVEDEDSDVEDLSSYLKKKRGLARNEKRSLGGLPPLRDNSSGRLRKNNKTSKVAPCLSITKSGNRQNGEIGLMESPGHAGIASLEACPSNLISNTTTTDRGSAITHKMNKAVMDYADTAFKFPSSCISIPGVSEATITNSAKHIIDGNHVTLIDPASSQLRRQELEPFCGIPAVVIYLVQTLSLQFCSPICCTSSNHSNLLSPFASLDLELASDIQFSDRNDELVRIAIELLISIFPENSSEPENATFNTLATQQDLEVLLSLDLLPTFSITDGRLEAFITSFSEDSSSLLKLENPFFQHLCGIDLTSRIAGGDKIEMGPDHLPAMLALILHRYQSDTFCSEASLSFLEIQLRLLEKLNGLIRSNRVFEIFYSQNWMQGQGRDDSGVINDDSTRTVDVERLTPESRMPQSNRDAKFENTSTSAASMLSGSVAVRFIRSLGYLIKDLSLRLEDSCEVLDFSKLNENQAKLSQHRYNMQLFKRQRSNNIEHFPTSAMKSEADGKISFQFVDICFRFRLQILSFLRSMVISHEIKGLLLILGIGELIVTEESLIKGKDETQLNSELLKSADLSKCDNNLIRYLCFMWASSVKALDKIDETKDRVKILQSKCETHFTINKAAVEELKFQSACELSRLLDACMGVLGNVTWVAVVGLRTTEFVMAHLLRFMGSTAQSHKGIQRLLSTCSNLLSLLEDD